VSAWIATTSASMPGPPMVTLVPLMRTRLCSEYCWLLAPDGSVCNLAAQGELSSPLRTDRPPTKRLPVDNSCTEPPWPATTANCAPSATSMLASAVCVTTSLTKAICRSAGVRLPVRSASGVTRLPGADAFSVRMPPLTMVLPINAIAPASIWPPAPTVTASSCRLRSWPLSRPADSVRPCSACSDKLLLPHRLPSLTALTCWPLSRSVVPVALTGPLRSIAPLVLRLLAIATAPSALTDPTLSSPVSVSLAPLATLTSLCSGKSWPDAVVASSPLSTRVLPV
jgi:hypothetical protein